MEKERNKSNYFFFVQKKQKKSPKCAGKRGVFGESITGACYVSQMMLDDESLPEVVIVEDALVTVLLAFDVVDVLGKKE